MSALDHITGLVNDGSEPDDAIAKIASDMKIPAGHIDLVAHAYNTGRTNMQRKSNTNVFDKAAEFTVANPANIIAKMFKQEKSAQEKFRSTSVSSEYTREPTWTSNKPLVKSASRLDLTDGKTVEPYAKETEGDAKKAYNEISFCKKSVDSFRVDATKLRDDIYKDVYSLVDFFKTAGNVPFVDVKTNVSLLFDKAGTVIMDLVKERYPACEKQASLKKWSSANKNSEPYKTVARLVENIEVYTDVTNKLVKAAELVSEMEAALLRPFVRSPRHSILNGIIPSSTEKVAFGSVLGSAASRGVDLLQGSEIAKEVATQFPGTTPTDKLLRKDLQKMYDPEHESNLRNAQVHSMLHDLISNDDVISGHHPEDTLRIYNELSQVAPRVASQKMFVRSHLRKRLQYGGDQVDPFEIIQLLDAEKKLKDRDDIPGNTGAMGMGPIPTSSPAPAR